MIGYDADGRDPGLAAERTDLAWSRSGLAMVACGAVLLRGLTRSPALHEHFVVGACIIALGALTSALGGWHARYVRTRANRHTRTSDLLPISLGVATIGIAAFVIAAAPR